MLDRVARGVVLANIREQVSPRWAALRDELLRHPGERLAAYLLDSGRDLANVLRGDGRSWSALCRDAGKTLPPAGPREQALARRTRVLAHVDDVQRRESYRALLARPGNTAPVKPGGAAAGPDAVLLPPPRRR